MLSDPHQWYTHSWTSIKREGSIWWYDTKSQHRCGEDIGEKPCRNFPPRAQPRCHIHTERNELAVLPENAVTRKRVTTSYLPPVYHRRFEELLDISDPSDLTSDAALLQMRRDQLTMRLSDGQFDIDQVLRMSNNIGEALFADDSDAALLIWQELHEIIAGAQGDDEVWRDIAEIIDRRAKIAKNIEDIQHKRQNVVTANQFKSAIERILVAFERCNQYDSEHQRTIVFQRGLMRAMEEV